MSTDLRQTVQTIQEMCAAALRDTARPEPLGPGHVVRVNPAGPLPANWGGKAWEVQERDRERSARQDRELELQADAELGQVLLRFIDRLTDPSPNDPLEKIVRELDAAVQPIIRRHHDDAVAAREMAAPDAADVLRRLDAHISAAGDMTPGQRAVHEVTISLYRDARAVIGALYRRAEYRKKVLLATIAERDRLLLWLAQAERERGQVKP